MADYTAGPVNISRKTLAPQAMQLTADNAQNVADWLNGQGALAGAKVVDGNLVVGSTELDPSEQYFVRLDTNLKIEILDSEQFHALYEEDVA